MHVVSGVGECRQGDGPMWPHPDAEVLSVEVGRGDSGTKGTAEESSGPGGTSQIAHLTFTFLF